MTSLDGIADWKVVAIGVGVGVGVGYLLSLRKPPTARSKYPQFQGTAAIQNQLNTDAAKASAVHCGKLNRATLERSGLLGKLWPLRMRCYKPGSAAGTAAAAATGSRTKTVHFIRHGQGFHNSLADFCLAYGIQDTNPYTAPENFDPPLTEIGRQQARALQPYARTTNPELVVVSPMARALKTSNIAYEHLIGTVPFIAHEGCKEKSHGNACDYRRPTAEAATDFPNVDFSLVVPTDPLLPNLEEETDTMQSDRAYEFMQWLLARPEREIVVSSHSAWLFNVLNTVLQCEDPEVASWFDNGELRTVQVTCTDL